MGLADNKNFLPLEVVATRRVIDRSMLLDKVASGGSSVGRRTDIQNDTIQHQAPNIS